MDYLKAWKNPEYRSTLGEKELGEMPLSPAGFVELDDAALLEINAGTADFFKWLGKKATGPVGFVTTAVGCFTVNATVCNGTCGVFSHGCCG